MSTPTEAQIVAAARALNKRHAELCNVNEADSWNIQGDDFREDARLALMAALAAPGGEQQQPDCWAVLTPNGSKLVTTEEAKGLHKAYPLYASPQALQAVPPVTDEMVAAYLKANDVYWKLADEQPPPVGRWRNGTPSEATRVGLQAALLAARPQAVQAPTPPTKE